MTQADLFHELSPVKVDRINPPDVHHGAEMRADWPVYCDGWADAKAMDAPQQFPSGSARVYETGYGSLIETGWCGSRECTDRLFA